ncbi:zinc ABC transporter substrate-binding protein [Inquilinus sp. CAU 1745]|uniref:zinc ABC transporter substrate-binding protein n=1 Tax=Inquilinus sp. CAU 1745 TaxID=3140369 RepID=UPI00325BFB48
MRKLPPFAAALFLLGAASPLPALAEAPSVAVSIKPLHSLVAGVMGDLGQPDLLVEGAGSPHTYSLRPSDARALADADLVVWTGPALETFLIGPLETLAEDARTLAVADAEGVELLPVRSTGAWEGHHHEHDHEGEDHGHDHSAAYDAHLWLDPHNAAAIVESVADALSELDAENAAAYAANADSVLERLDALDADLRARLAPVGDAPFVVFHDAYQYFGAHYGLNAVGSITVSPELPPGAQRLREIQHTIAESGARCVFSEPQFEPDLVDTVVEGTDVRRGQLDPLGVAVEEGPEQYFRLMTDLADNLVACLSDAS